MSGERDIEQSLRDLKWEIPPHVDEKILSDGLQALDQATAQETMAKKEKKASPLRLPFVGILGRAIRRSGKLAAAVAGAIGIALFLLVNSNSSHTAFAQMLDRVRDVRSVSYLEVRMINGHVYRVQNCTILKPRCIRSERSSSVQISKTDEDGTTTLTLIRHTKHAIRTKTPAFLPDGQTNILDAFRNVGSKSGEFVRKEKLGGTETLVYLVKDFPLWVAQEAIVWIDPESHLPIQIEAMDANSAQNSRAHFVNTNFAWHTDVDESLFRLEVPAGYSLTEMIFGTPTEKDLVETLRLYTSITANVFPTTLNNLTAWFTSDRIRPDKGATQEELREVNTRRFEVCLKGEQGLLFIAGLKPENDWHYMGDGVRYGEADKPVCWWKPEGAASYRAIWGDLSIRDIQAADLPQITRPRPTESPKEIIAWRGPWLGVGLEEDLGRQPCKLTYVIPKTPAAIAGLQEGDIVVRWNNEGIYSAYDLARRIWRAEANAKVVLTISRNDQEINVPVTLGTGM